MKLKNLVLISILILSLFLVACSSNGTFAGKAVATASNCIDSDGMNYTNNGRVIINANNRNTTYTDACSGNQLLYERYCNGVSLATAQIYCDQTFGSQYTCYAGRCIISQSSCTDTDGGRNYNQKGTMTIRTPLGQTSTNSDYCQNSTQLFEHYCINGVSGSRGGYNCYNLGENYTCSNGACVGPTVNFCYYIDANGTQMPAGWRWRDFPYSDYGLKNYTGTRTNYGDTGFSCVNSDNIGILYVPTCGISPYYTSGNVQQGMNISFSYCGFGCNPTTNRCCMKIGNATQFCDGNMIVNITNTDCGVKEYRINCANEVDFYTGRPKVCDIDSCMSSCTPGEQITTCRYNYGRYTCNAQGNYYIYNSGASSCPTGTACNGYMCVNNQTNITNQTCTAGPTGNINCIISSGDGFYYHPYRYQAAKEYIASNCSVYNSSTDTNYCSNNFFGFTEPLCVKNVGCCSEDDLNLSYCSDNKVTNRTRNSCTGVITTHYEQSCNNNGGSVLTICNNYTGIIGCSYESCTPRQERYICSTGNSNVSKYICQSTGWGFRFNATFTGCPAGTTCQNGLCS